MSLRTGALELRLTPLDPRVLRLAAPDLRTRLHSLASDAQLDGWSGRTPLLVTFYSNEPDQTVSPAELRLEVGGRRLEVLEIIPITRNWNELRLRSGEPAAAIYILGERLDALAPFRVLYGGAATDGWRDVIPILQAEERRVVGEPERDR